MNLVIVVVCNKIHFLSHDGLTTIIANAKRFATNYRAVIGFEFWFKRTAQYYDTFRIINLQGWE